MASHRKPPTRPFSLPTARAALTLVLAGAASATSFAGSGHAQPQDRAGDRQGRSTEQVRSEVAALHREAERATEKYNGAREKAEAAQGRLESLGDEAARKRARLNTSRDAVGSYATAQYREGSGADPTLRLALSSSPEEFLESAAVTERAGARQATAVNRISSQTRALDQVREEASGAAASLARSSRAAEAHKRTVRGKLRRADAVLRRLSAEDRAEALREDAPGASAGSGGSRKEARGAATARDTGSAGDGGGGREGGGTAPPATGASGASADSAPAPGGRSARAVAFARQAVGKPYVWGATGPSGYDCSGLTQAAWKAAGVSLPRTTYAQIESGKRVSRSQLAPGDLVFFYGSVSHVGIYVGGGRMIHAPRPGTAVRVAPISEMPFSGAARPA